jgi:putative heme iron utilization protein
MIEPPKSVLRPLDAAAIAGAKALVRDADHAALAVLEPQTGDPLASRVGLATLPDGTPLIVVSSLAANSAALSADPRCSLLIGEVGKGEPLAHPRITLKCRAELIAATDAAEARACYLARHPKATIYVDLPDFRFFRLAILSASYNAGFGRAYALEGAALIGGE